jgi:hypothetical protein
VRAISVLPVPGSPSRNSGRCSLAVGDVVEFQKLRLAVVDAGGQFGHGLVRTKTPHCLRRLDDCMNASG